jgi:3-deoxy-D-manno-octulosonate 8-phosphate phosphatase (KDO 8-P phosphatase)
MDRMVTSRPRVSLTPAGARRRARNIRLFLTDVDGVLTDTGIYYSARGEELYRFSRRDGMGADLLQAAGIATGLMTSEPSEIIRRRAEKLHMQEVHLGVKDKEKHLLSLLAAAGLGPEAVAYIGDDVNDLGVLTLVRAHGLTAAPGDAVRAVSSIVHYRCAAAGGAGAYREFADWILDLRRSAPARRR